MEYVQYIIRTQLITLISKKSSKENTFPKFVYTCFKLSRKSTD